MCVLFHGKLNFSLKIVNFRKYFWVSSFNTNLQNSFVNRTLFNKEIKDIKTGVIYLRIKYLVLTFALPWKNVTPCLLCGKCPKELLK